MKKNKIIWIGMFMLTPIFIYIIYFTNLVSPTYQYVRLKNGKEYRDVTVRYSSDIDVVLDGQYYITTFDIDSLVR